MKTKHTKALSPLTAKVLVYSIFACLCHGAGVLLFTRLNPCALPHSHLISTATYMLEHTLMSITLTLIGSFLLQIIQNET